MNIEHEAWHIRQPKFEEERRYHNLIEIHQLTHQWLEAIHPTKNQDGKQEESFRLKRFIPSELNQNLWLLEKLRLDRLPPQLETLVNETTVSQFLDELEETIWIVQMSVLENILGDTTDSNRLAIYNQLEQVTWHHGKTIAEKRWPNFSSSFEHVYDALKNSPYYSSSKSFLLEHQNNHDFSFYWMTSPLSREALKLSKELQTLCTLHHHGFRGFLYGLIRQLKVEITPATLRNTKAWCIHVSAN